MAFVGFHVRLTPKVLLTSEKLSATYSEETKTRSKHFGRNTLGDPLTRGYPVNTSDLHRWKFEIRSSKSETNSKYLMAEMTETATHKAVLNIAP